MRCRNGTDADGSASGVDASPLSSNRYRCYRTLQESRAARGHMTHLLLAGAGFTHNWKGWLAKEMEGDLLLRLRGNPLVHARVRDADGFESALAGLQLDVKGSKPGAK